MDLFTPQLNLDFVKQHNTLHVEECLLVSSLNGVDNHTAITTSCIITAQALRWSLTHQLEWNQLSTEIPNCDLYQILFSYDDIGSSLDHIVTVYQGKVIQSFWKKTSIYVRDDIDLTLINKCSSKELWKLLVDDQPPNDDLYILYSYP